MTLPHPDNSLEEYNVPTTVPEEFFITSEYGCTVLRLSKETTAEYGPSFWYKVMPETAAVHWTRDEAAGVSEICWAVVVFIVRLFVPLVQ